MISPEALDFTEAEAKELEATREALRDVYGSTSSTVRDNNIATVGEGARGQLQGALVMMPQEERAAYDEAMKVCPRLVETESNPTYFLEACAFDPWAAAQRICVYWQKRREIFQERAFLPMDITGEGAVPQDVVESLKCGGTTILPPDSKNRPIFYSDRSRFSRRCIDEDARIKVIFYTLHVLLESDLARMNGYIVLTTMDTAKYGQKQNTPRKNIFRLFQSGAFPMTIRAFHIVVFKKRSLIESSVPIWLKLVERWNFLSLRTVACFAESREEAVDNLKRYCFLEKYIPKELGGNLDFEDYFNQWLEMCTENEYSWFNDVFRNRVVVENEDEGNTQQGALESLAVAATQVHAQEVKARKRKQDAIYQRKKRQQRKQEFSNLAIEVEELKRTHAALKKEHVFLESLVKRADDIVKLCDQITLGDEASNNRSSQSQALLPTSTFQTSLPEMLKLRSPPPNTLRPDSWKGHMGSSATMPSRSSQSLKSITSQVLMEQFKEDEKKRLTSHLRMEQQLQQQRTQSDPLSVVAQRLAEEAITQNALMNQQLVAADPTVALQNAALETLQRQAQWASSNAQPSLVPNQRGEEPNSSMNTMYNMLHQN